MRDESGDALVCTKLMQKATVIQALELSLINIWS